MPPPSGRSLAQEREQLGHLVQVGLVLCVIHAVGESIQAREEVRSALDLVANPLNRPHQPVGFRCPRFVGGIDYIFDQARRFFDDCENVAELVGGAGGYLAYERRFPIFSRAHDSWSTWGLAWMLSAFRTTRRNVSRGLAREKRPPQDIILIDLSPAMRQRTLRPA